MSAIVLPLEREEAFWFKHQRLMLFHAFELVDGELEPLSACGRLPLERCVDVPSQDPAERQGWHCTWCLQLVTTGGKP